MPHSIWPTLTDPTRRGVLDLLRRRPHSVSELVDALRVSQPAASKHLRILREAGLVRVTGMAQRRIYSIDPAPLIELDVWLAPYRALWNDRLDALGRHLDETAQAGEMVRPDRIVRPDETEHRGKTQPLDETRET